MLNALVPISFVASSANVLTVNPKVPATNLKELIAFAKANPDNLNYASQGVCTTAHLAAELFKDAAGIKLMHIPYQGAGPSLTDLLGGQVDLLFAELSATGPYIKDGKIRPLAVGSTTHIPSLPNVAPAADDLPGFIVMTQYRLIAPPSTPASIVDLLSKSIAEVLSQPDVFKRLNVLSITPVGSTPTEFVAFLRRRRVHYRRPA